MDADAKRERWIVMDWQRRHARTLGRNVAMKTELK